MHRWDGCQSRTNAQNLLQQSFEVCQGHHIRPIAQGCVGRLVDFHEQGIDSDSSSSASQVGHKLPLPP
jgi:hypothetical protein